MATIITCEGNTLTMTVTDEVEQVTQVKLKRFLTYWYVELCKRQVSNKFECEGCEKYWGSQRDHECCLKSEEEIFDGLYDDVKYEVPLDTLRDVCRQLTVATEIPMTAEWSLFISRLRNMSAQSAFNL